MKCLANFIFAVMILTNFTSCKTASPGGSNLEGATKVSSNPEIFTCYKVMSVDSPSELPDAKKIKDDAKEVCIGEKPMTVTMKDEAGANILSWQFTGIQPMRCPRCYELTGGREYSATITGTIAPLIYNLSLGSRGLGGTVRLTLQQVIEKTVGEDIYGCYKVTNVTSQSNTTTVKDIKKDVSSVCVNKSPLSIALLKKEEEAPMLTWTFTQLAPLRCPNCYEFKGGNEYAATIAATIVINVFNMSLDTRGFGGSVKLSLLKETENQ
jgi:hypothetical protein